MSYNFQRTFQIEHWGRAKISEKKKCKCQSLVKLSLTVWLYIISTSHSYFHYNEVVSIET